MVEEAEHNHFGFSSCRHFALFCLNVIRMGSVITVLRYFSFSKLGELCASLGLYSQYPYLAVIFSFSAFSCPAVTWSRSFCKVSVKATCRYSFDRKFPILVSILIYFNSLASHLDYNYHADKNESWHNSVSVVSDYRLDDRGSIPGRGKIFFL
jgi:hypothetical protein